MSEFNVKTDFGYLKNFKVYDKDDNELGKVIDFTVDRDYKPRNFILGGSFLEELRESLGLKPDDDPVVKISDITNISLNDNLIKLRATSEEVCTKLDSSAFEKGEMMFSQICKRSVIASDGSSIGRIVDALFSSNNPVSFVLGDSKFVEFLERIGLASNYDLLIPSKNVMSIDDESVKIDKSREELSVLLNNEAVGEREVQTYVNANTEKVARYARNASTYSYDSTMP
jgi:sporulation protein YlmC with PRC-barrel domain